MASGFSNYRYNPDSKEDIERLKQEIPEFNFECPDIDKLAKYTCYVYDPHNDLRQLFPTDFNRRKYEAALKAGFKLNKQGVFDKWMEDCIVGENEAYNHAIVAYAVSFEIADLPEFIFYREMFYGELKAGMSATDSKVKKEVMANVEIAKTRMTALEKKLFTHEEVINIRNSLYQRADKHKLNLRPEDRATMIENKELADVLPDPHHLLK